MQVHQEDLIKPDLSKHWGNTSLLLATPLSHGQVPSAISWPQHDLLLPRKRRTQRKRQT